MAVQSARGLFLATGNIGSEERARAEHDFLPTPPEPTRSFLAAEYPRLKHFDKIWEPAAGDGAMVRELQACGFDVVASDLIDRGCNAQICDFFDYKSAPAKAVVTNPPYFECNWRDGKGRWIEHSMQVLKLEYMALLLSWNWPAAAGLGQLYEKFPPARVYLMRWKIDFTNQGAPPMLNGWFVWDKKWQGETALRMLDRRMDVRQPSLLGEVAI